MVLLDGRRVRYLRRQRGFSSQKALAHRTRELDPEGAGVSQRLLWDAENGRPVSPRAHHLIARALEVPPGELLRPTFAQRLDRFARQPVSAAAFILVGVLMGLGAVTAWLVTRPGYDPPVAAVRADAEHAAPVIRAVHFIGGPGDYAMTIVGTGFGSAPFRGTYFGRVPYFRIFDGTVHFEAGYSTDETALAFLSWSDRRIEIAGLPGSPGDSVVLNLWNPQTHLGAAWGGNIPPVPRTPRIDSAIVSSNAIVIKGLGFGPSPSAVPFTSNIGYVVLCDGAYHHWGDGKSVEFLVGTVFSPTKLAVTQWTDTRIVINGFVGPPLSDGMSIAAGDPVTVELWNPRMTSQVNRTAWGGVAQ